MKICPKCTNPKQDTEFYLQNGKPHGYCRDCAKEESAKQRAENGEEIRAWKRTWYKKNSDKIRQRERERDYSLNNSAFIALLQSQDFKCAICTKPLILGNIIDAPHIDHDHSCCPGNAHSCGKCIRGLLCINCNNGLGRFKDDPDLLQRASEYLRRFKPC